MLFLSMLSICLIANSFAATTTTSGNVLILSESNFSSTISTTGQITVVEFFAPWCGHCKHLAPEYAEAANTLAGLSETAHVRLATVDATIETSLAQQYDISGYPTLKIFRDGKTYDYEGPREAKGIVDYMKSQAAPSWSPPVDAVVELTDENFDKVTQGKLVLVEFYAPWCGHCKAMAPKFEKAARTLANQPEPIVLAKLDATAYASIAQRFSITGYPTFKVFRNGVASDFNGGREMQEIVDEMKAISGPAAQYIEDAVALHMRVKKTATVLVIAFLDSELTDLANVESAADGLRKDIAVVYTSHVGAQQQYHVPARTLVILQPAHFQSPLELKRAELDLSKVNAAQIAEFISNNKYPLVGHRTKAVPVNSNLYNERPLVCVYYDVQFSPDLQKETNYWRDIVLRVAKKHVALANKQLYFAVADEQEYKSELEDLGLFGKDREISVVIWSKDYKFVMNDEFDFDTLSEFVENFLEGNLKPFIRSQKAAKKIEGGVTVVTGNTFEKIVLDPTKDVLIELYAPWCGHCKSLTPIYSQLAKKLREVKNVVIAKIDATSNDVPVAYRAKGYPTILLASKTNKHAPKAYDGERDVKSFMKFLSDNTQAAIPRDEL